MEDNGMCCSMKPYMKGRIDWKIGYKGIGVGRVKDNNGTRSSAKEHNVHIR